VLQDGTLTATYTYDANGNRIGGPGLTTTPVYDAQDRLLSYGKWTYVYSANGELQSKTDTTSGQVTSYSYDGMGNLRHVGLSDGRAIDYVIDSLNRRVAKKVNGNVVRKWVYSDSLIPAAEFDGGGNLVSRFAGTNYLVQGGTTYRVIKDHLGSPRLIVNATSGVVAQRLDYDEWGNVAVSGTQPAGWQPFGYAGGLYDPDTGLVRFGARDYDPVAGRWTAIDPIRFAGGQSNLFAYVDNDPVNRIDREGTDGMSFGCGKAVTDMSLACLQTSPPGVCAAAIGQMILACFAKPIINALPDPETVKELICPSRPNSSHPDYNNPDFGNPRLYSNPTDVPGHPSGDPP
jgi:RHS repeat-associated protein